MTTTDRVRSYVAARIAHEQRLAKPGNCPKCGAAILSGPDHDRMAAVATVDAEPVRPDLEPRVVAAGLSTYDLDNGTLCYREPWHRGNTQYPVYVWHVCRGVVA